MTNVGNNDSLILAAEECSPEEFEKLHAFSKEDERIIVRLVAHGPVLLQGSRGSGKSALMLAAVGRIAPKVPDSNVFGVYVSLRHLPLIRSFGREYEEILCRLLVERIQDQLDSHEIQTSFSPDREVGAVQRALAELSVRLQKRVAVYFDDAAHLGREASLVEFFDIFRTLSSSTVSCKATIYPGVTEFGPRFDIYNDATVIDVSRNEEDRGYAALFAEVMDRRYPTLRDQRYTQPLTHEGVAAFLARSVLGNMRAFTRACQNVLDRCLDGEAIGLAMLGESLRSLATDHFWPLLDEVQPKLGKYVPVVDTARTIAELLNHECGHADARRSAIVHREILARLSKAFEILEYVGFIAKREASRAMKSGGRGSRYVLNLCNLIEQVPGSRLTADLFHQWSSSAQEAQQFHSRNSEFAQIHMPALDSDADLEVLAMNVETLKRSNAYPYGLTDNKIQHLIQAGFETIGDLARASDPELRAVVTIGDAWVDRIRSVVGQAIWM